MSKVICKILQENDELVFFSGDEEFARLPISGLRRVIQVLWGGDLIGPNRDSLWIFDCGLDLIVAPSTLRDWEAKVLPALEETNSIPVKWETYDLHCPLPFARKTFWSAWLAGLRQVDLIKITAPELNEFLSANPPRSVPRFSTYL